MCSLWERTTKTFKGEGSKPLLQDKVWQGFTTMRLQRRKNYENATW